MRRCLRWQSTPFGAAAAVDKAVCPSRERPGFVVWPGGPSAIAVGRPVGKLSSRQRCVSRRGDRRWRRRERTWRPSLRGARLQSAQSVARPWCAGPRDEGLTLGATSGPVAAFPSMSVRARSTSCQPEDNRPARGHSPMPSSSVAVKGIGVVRAPRCPRIRRFWS